LRQFINGENEKAVLAECISQVLTDKGSPIFLQGEPKAKGILEIEQETIQDSTQDIQDSNSFYPYDSSYPHLASKDKNAGVKELREGEEENQKQNNILIDTLINNDSIGIEVVGRCFNAMEEKVKIGLNYTQYSGK